MELKVKDIVNVYTILKDAKLTKMDSMDKFKLIKMMRAMKPTAEEWDSFLSTVDEKLKKENHDDFIEKARKWQQEGEKTTLTEEEKLEVNTYFIEYQREKNECIKDELEKTVSLEFEKLQQGAFEKLIDSNDWDVKNIMELEHILVE